jgi:uncharacterized tellurite resistance protein B-like protein
MHIFLALAGSIITILILINRLKEAGFTLSSFNPFAWYRKHQWLNKYYTKPIYTIAEPQKVAALLIVAVAKADGLISLEEKNQILNMFEKEFGHSKQEASGLFTSSAFFLKDEDDIAPNLDNILKLSANDFTDNQIIFTIECMQKIADLSHENSTGKDKIITGFTQYFEKMKKTTQFDRV